MAVLLALGAALSWGIGDFLGGLTSRRADELYVTVLSQLSGLVVLLAAFAWLPGTPSRAALVFGAAAGVGGAMGLAAYFRALAIGPMGVTAPLSALVGAAVPVTVGLVAGERPDPAAAFGIALGLLAVVLVSRPAGDDTVPHDPARLRRGMLWASVAGLGFGWFFVALDMTPADSGLWPLVAARPAGILALGVLLAQRRPARPGRVAAGVAAASGLLDMLANTLFLLAVRQGLLVLVSVLTSLYPVGVVVLARLVLRERLSRGQLTGIAFALGAAALIAS